MTQQIKRSTTTAVVPSTLTEGITAPPKEPTAHTRHDGWTRERMIAFLEALVETASVTTAAQSVGMTRQTAYRLRARLIGQPFDHAWEAALEFGLQQLHCEALDRAMNGVPVPIFYGGEQVGERRHYNETLTRFLLSNPNARPVVRDPDVRAAALSIWGMMRHRIATGPDEWTITEVKRAQALARKTLDESAVDDEGKKRRRKCLRVGELALSAKEYQRLGQKLGWRP
jgi:hypothetical protein